MRRLTLTLAAPDQAARALSVDVQEVLLAGYTGRDRARVAEHIRELATLGVAPPARVPAVYTVPPALLTTEATIAASPAYTSGEAEFFLLPRQDGEVLVGAGSDHTDRQHEAIDVDESKARCPKPVCPLLWRYADLRDHWDRLELRSWITGPHAGAGRLYQEGRLAALLPVEDLLQEVRAAGHPQLQHRIVFGGTLPTIGGLAFGHHFAVELYDPVLDRRLTCAYDVTGSPEDAR